jgi:hypothetical protein
MYVRPALEEFAVIHDDAARSCRLPADARLLDMQNCGCASVRVSTSESPRRARFTRASVPSPSNPPSNNIAHRSSIGAPTGGTFTGTPTATLALACSMASPA